VLDILHKIFVGPFIEMSHAPDLLVQVLWEGFVSGTLYALIALGFVLIYKASSVFNFAQGIMVVFSALTLVGLIEMGLPAWLALLMTVGVMYVLAVSVERTILLPLVNQSQSTMIMATIGLSSFLIGFGGFIFGGEPKSMPVALLGIPTGSMQFSVFNGHINIQNLDLAAAVMALVMVTTLGIFFSKTRIGRALRAVADDHQAALSVGITLKQIWVIVWFTAGIVGLTTGIFWGARSDVSFSLQIIALKALPVLILGGFTSIPGVFIGGLIIGIGEQLFEYYWGVQMGGGTQGWVAYMIALLFLWVMPQGLFGEKIIERI